ncbi:MAG: DUF4386 domain-containing protein [Saprospiraceae bacterium]
MKNYARLAGLLYLVIAITGGFSIGYMPGEIIVEGDPHTTFQNLLSNQTLFKWGIAGDIAVLVFETLLTVMLFALLKPYSDTGIRVATYSRLAMAIIMAMNLINYMIPAVFVFEPALVGGVSPMDLETTTMLFFKAHKFGEYAWQLFFSIHLFTLGYVIWKSKKAPFMLGILMLIGGVGYAGDSFIRFVWVDTAWISTTFSVLLVLAVISEFWFAFWLLFKGKKLNAAPKV